jgi:ankyrin repeat protein
MAGSLDIVRYLIEIGVDVNIKTFDEWLPIHLAIKQQNLPMIDLLAGQPRLNVNLCTVHGLAINMAIEAHNVRIVERLLAKDANLAIRDHLGRTAYDALRLNPDFLIKKLLDKAEQRPEFLG